MSIAAGILRIKRYDPVKALTTVLAHFDANDEASFTYDSGTTVATWTDRKNGIVLTANGSTKPERNVTLDGVKGIRFTATTTTDQRMQCLSGDDALDDFYKNGAYLLVVHKKKAGGETTQQYVVNKGNWAFISQNNDGGSGLTRFVLNRNSTNGQVWTPSADDLVDDTLTVSELGFANQRTIEHVHMRTNAVYETDVSTGYFQLVDPASYPVDSDAALRFAVGGVWYDGGNTNGYNGEVFEVLALSKEPTASERMQLYAYLEQKYPSLSLTKPTIEPFYIGAGQSNMNGNAVIANAAVAWNQTFDDFLIYNDGATDYQALDPGSNNKGGSASTHGFELHFADLHAKRFGTRDFRFIKYGVGGQSLHTYWNSRTPGTGWTNLQTEIYAGKLEALRDGVLPDVKGYVWMQGEEDAYTGNTVMANAYNTNFTNFTDDQRAILENYGIATTSMKFIAGTIQEASGSEADYPNRDTVNTAIKAVMNLDPNGEWVDNSAATHIDAIHFDGPTFARMARNVFGKLYGGDNESLREDLQLWDTDALWLANLKTTDFWDWLACYYARMDAAHLLETTDDLNKVYYAFKPTKNLSDFTLTNGNTEVTAWLDSSAHGRDAAAVADNPTIAAESGINNYLAVASDGTRGQQLRKDTGADLAQPMTRIALLFLNDGIEDNDRLLDSGPFYNRQALYHFSDEIGMYGGAAGPKYANVASLWDNAWRFHAEVYNGASSMLYFERFNLGPIDAGSNAARGITILGGGADQDANPTNFTYEGKAAMVIQISAALSLEAVNEIRDEVESIFGLTLAS